MKPFMDKDFLLSTDVAKELYHEIAEKAPILDYHCHIDPKDIATDKSYDNIYQVWLGKPPIGDHYKWRQMRVNGVPEEYITGDKPDREKFQMWAETLPKLIGNPLYHWSHLELRKYFGYEGYLNGDTAEEVWNLCNEKLHDPSMSVRNIIRQSNVKLICTTDDPIDTLEWHQKIKDDASFDVQVLPAWRPDKLNNIELPTFAPYIAKLAERSGITISDMDSLEKAVADRLDFFQSMGCSVTDHGVRYVAYAPAEKSEVDAILKKAMNGEAVTADEAAKYKYAMLIFLAKEYNKRDMVMQIHYGCVRDNNADMFAKLGPDTGFDSVDNYAPADQLAKFFNALSATDEIPKTILYSLNPCDSTTINTIAGCFCKAPVKNRITQGAAWWFNDHKQGMIEQMVNMANLSALGNFNGMLTDSRSFLSYARHDYFRRILCELIGQWVENGEYPYDKKALTEIVKGISFNNAVKYFGFDLELC